MGLIKSIKKRIKRHKERKENRKFKRDLQNNMQSFLNSNNKGILESDISSVGGGVFSCFFNFFSSKDFNSCLHAFFTSYSRLQTKQSYSLAFS